MNDRIAYLIDKYFNQGCTPSEQEELAHWVELSGNEEQVKTALMQVWQKYEPVISMPEDMSERIVRHIYTAEENSHEKAEPTIGSKRTQYLKLRYWMRYAAAVLLIVAGVGIYHQITKKTFVKTGYATYADASISVDYVRHLLLPDSSSVTLQKGSRLLYPHQFDGQTRNVELIGEAYFDIKHDERKPFIIRTGKVTTTVLGTAFNINDNQATHSITITVTRGRVKVEDEKQVLGVLAANNEIVYSTLQEAAVKDDHVTAVNSIQWAQKDMVFEAAPFEDIIRMVSKRYGVDINFANDALKKCLITVSFSGTEKLEDVLRVLCDVRHASFSINEDQSFSISGKGCDE